MPFKKVLDSLEGVSEDHKSLYEKKDDGKYHFKYDVEVDTSGLEENRNQLLGEKKALADQLKAFDGIDPEEVRKLMSDKATRDRKVDEEAGNYQKLLDQMKETHATQATEKDTRIQNLESSLQREMVGRRSDEAILKHGGNPKLLGPHVRSQLKIIEKNGESNVFVVDDSGEPLLSKKANTASDFMTPDELVGSLKESDDFAGAFKGSGATGGGASTEHKQTNTESDGTLTTLQDGGLRFGS